MPESRAVTETDIETTVRQFKELPSERQREAADVIAFLSALPRSEPGGEHSPACALKDESYVGMWKDREDMDDATRWVRELRRKQWSGYPRRTGNGRNGA